MPFDYEHDDQADRPYSNDPPDRDEVVQKLPKKFVLLEYEHNTLIKETPYCKVGPAITGLKNEAKKRPNNKFVVQSVKTKEIRYTHN